MIKISCVAFITLTSSVTAIDIQLDFSHDQAAQQFFSSNPMAQSAVEKAATDIGNMLSNSMAPVNSDVFEGTSGDTTAKIDWSWNYINPVSGSTVTLNTPSIAADTVKIYVGTRNLSGDALGGGGAGGAGAGPSAVGPASGWIEAVDLAEAASNASIGRGSGPLIGTISGSPNYSGQVAHYDLDYGLSVGNLWFDADTDNNGLRDSNATLSNFWHYDTDTPVAAGKTDLYSVALHEILHVMGVGTSQTWNDLSSGSEWLGSEASLAAGTSTLLDGDGFHATEGIMSVRVSDGTLQEALVSSSINTGARQGITELDLAFLSDLGYELASADADASSVPESSSSALILLAGMLGISRRSRAR